MVTGAHPLTFKLDDVSYCLSFSFLFWLKDARELLKKVCFLLFGVESPSQRVSSYLLYIGVADGEIRDTRSVVL